METKQARNFIKDVIFEKDPIKGLNLELRESNSNLENIHNSHKDGVDELKNIHETLKQPNEVGQQTNATLEETNQTLREIADNLKATVNDKLDNVANETKNVTEYVTGYLKGLKGDQGEPGQSIKGDPGYTPQRGIDYFTQEDINEIIKEVLKKATPIKGVHFNDGIDGKDAELPDVEQLVKLAVKQIKELKGNDRIELTSIRNGEQIARALNYPKVKGVLKDMPDSLLEGDQRWGGGGDTVVAGTDITITTNATGQKVISAASGFDILIATGTVDGNNTIFTFTQVPTVVVSDGVWLTQLDNNGNAQWTNVGTTITMNIPPINSIFGIK